MTAHQPIAFLLTRTGEHALSIILADRFMRRLRGLMLARPLRPDQGLLLTECSSVHTCFMLQRLDLVYLDQSGVVTKCVARIQPWRMSCGAGRAASGVRLPAASHVLELAAGSIARLKIAAGSRLRHSALASDPPSEDISGSERRGNEASSTDASSNGFSGDETMDAAQRGRKSEAGPASSATSDTEGSGGMRPASARQTGSAMIEFAVVAPIITLLGLAAIQYGLLFFAKNQYNHAAFMAARAGTTEHANLDKIKEAYAQALIPLYARGVSKEKLDASLAVAQVEIRDHSEIVMLNPTAESFADFNNEDLQKKYGVTSQHVIANGGLAYKKPAIVPTGSGQNIQDANLLKLRITHAYKPQVPVIGTVYTRYLKWLDTGDQPFNTQQIAAGRIPVVTHVTVQMQSDAIEGTTVSTPGVGNGGTAIDPGTTPAITSASPACDSVLCTTGGDRPTGSPGAGGGGSNGSNDGAGNSSDGTAPGGICEPATATPIE